MERWGPLVLSSIWTGKYVHFLRGRTFRIIITCMYVLIALREPSGRGTRITSNYNHLIQLAMCFDFFILCDSRVHVPPLIQTPFFANSPERIIAKVKASSWSFKALCWSEVSDLAKDLIKGLLQVQYAFGVLEAPVEYLSGDILLE